MVYTGLRYTILSVFKQKPSTLVRLRIPKRKKKFIQLNNVKFNILTCYPQKKKILEHDV